jgi:hypothetical protein
MRSMEAPRSPLTFVVRVTQEEGGGLSGVVERVRSGEKQRFHSLAALAEVIAGMAERETQTRRQTQRRR